MHASQRPRMLEKLKRELGPAVLEALETEDVTEIMANPDGGLWIERLERGMERAGDFSAGRAAALIGTLAAWHGLVADEEAPTLACELPLAGARFQGWLPPVSDAPAFCIRRPAARALCLERCAADGALTARGARAIERAVDERRNILIAGGAGSGKTTLAGAVLDAVARRHPGQRLVLIEDTRELRPAAPNAVALRAGAGMSMLDLIRSSLRGRPDRLAVGEVRDGAAALALLKSWNTGHPGGIGTLHAGGARAALARLEQLVMEAAAGAMGPLIGQAIDLVVAMERAPGVPAGRRVAEMLAVRGYDCETEEYDTCPVPC